MKMKLGFQKSKEIDEGSLKEQFQGEISSKHNID